MWKARMRLVWMALLLVALGGIHVNSASAGKSLREKVRQKVLDEGERRADQPVLVKRLSRDRKRSFSAKATWTKRDVSGPMKCSVGVRVTLTKKKLRVRSDRRIRCRSISLSEFNDIEFQRGPGPKYCPGNSGETWNAKPAILGKPLEKATAIAERRGCEVRVVRRDGVNLVVTADLRFNRLNLAVRGPDQRVVRILDVG